MEGNNNQTNFKFKPTGF